MAVTRLILAVVAAVLATPVWAQDTSDRVVDAFVQWLERNNISSGQIAVARQGAILAEHSVRRSGAEDLASLSKAITAACVADLVQGGSLAWDDAVGAHLSNVADPLATVTIAQLITHSGGVIPDSTQGRMPEWRGPGKPAYQTVLDQIASRDLGPTEFAYSNDNYAVLGRIIDEVSGQSYAQHCAAQVTNPLHLSSAKVSDSFGRFAAWGGWEMTLADYAKFAWARYGQADPSKFPSVSIDGGASYGLGMFWRPFGAGGFNHWHFGALCFDDGPNFITFSVLFQNGWGVVTYAEGCPEADWFSSLDQAIVGAIFR